MSEDVSAREVKAGDFLVGLGNGYVVEVEANNGYMSYPNSMYNQAMPSDTVLITFHDQMGEECYLMLPGDSEVEVKNR